MRLAALLALLLACAHSPPPPPGPRPLGSRSSIAHGPAVLELELLYAVQPDRSVQIVAGLQASGSGSVGPLELTLTADKFLIDGSTGWSGEVVAGSKQQPTFTLRPQGTGAGWVKVRAVAKNGGEVSVSSPFLITADELKPCQTSDEACKGVTIPDDPEPAADAPADAPAPAPAA